MTPGKPEKLRPGARACIPFFYGVPHLFSSFLTEYFLGLLSLLISATLIYLASRVVLFA
jgi:hypothetical protein